MSDKTMYTIIGVMFSFFIVMVGFAMKEQQNTVTRTLTHCKPTNLWTLPHGKAGAQRVYDCSNIGKE